MVLLSARRRISRRLAASCWRSSWAARCTPNAPSSRRSLAGRARPERTRRVVASICSMFSPSDPAAVGGRAGLQREPGTSPRWPGAASPSLPGRRVVRRLIQGRAADLEDVQRLFEQRLDRVLGAGRPAGEVTQGGGFGPGPGGFLGPAGGEVHHHGHGGGDADEDQERQDVLRIADGQVADRRGGEVVHQQAAPQRGEDCRPQSADQRDRDGSGELDQDGRGDVLVRVQAEQQLQQHRQQRPPGRSPRSTRARPRSRSRAVAGAAAAERVGDHVDVDVAGVPDHPGADAAAKQAAQQPGEFAVAGDADDDLGGVDAAGEVQQGAWPGLRRPRCGSCRRGPGSVGAGLRAPAGDSLATPSAARTCTASRSPPLTRLRILAPRRIRTSPSGPPVSPMTMRSRAGQLAWIPFSARYLARPSSTRSASHSRASSRRAVRLPRRK